MPTCVAAMRPGRRAVPPVPRHSQAGSLTAARLFGLCLCLSLFCAQQSHAQSDAAPAGRAARLLPTAASELVLKSESLEFVFAPQQQAWHVSAHYDIVNPTARTLSAQLALPEARCNEESEFDDSCDPSRAQFSSLNATVRDRTLRLRKSRLPGSSNAAGAEAAWMLPLRWQAGEALPVDLHYLVPAGQSTDGGYSASYLMRGGAGWAKPIGHATFKFSFTARSCLVVEPEQLTRKSRRVVLRDAEPWLELVYEAYVWIPPSEVTLYFEPCVAPRDTEIAGCSVASELARFFYPAEANEEVEPIDEAGLRAALAKLSDDELARCRDGVFTTYAGYFQEPELKRLPSHPQASRHYTAPLLTAADWNWVHFLDGRVAEREAIKKQRQDAEHRAAQRAAARGCGCRLLAGTRRVPAAQASWATLVLLGWRLRRMTQRSRTKASSSTSA
jgi:hypothetical protein